MSASLLDQVACSCKGAVTSAKSQIGRFCTELTDDAPTTMEWKHGVPFQMAAKIEVFTEILNLCEGLIQSVGGDPMVVKNFILTNALSAAGSAARSTFDAHLATAWSEAHSTLTVYFD